MQFNVTTILHASLSDNGFSLDELVCKMKELFERKGFPEIIRQFLMLFDEVIKIKAMQSKDVPFRCKCGECRFVLDGKRDRTIRTSLGTLKLAGMTRLKCKSCGDTLVPLMEICGIDRYQTKTGELEKIVLEQCTQTSYRRAAATIRTASGSIVSHGTCRRWVLVTEAAKIDPHNEAMASMPGMLYVDGTKCKSLDDETGEPKRGDVKVLLAVDYDGNVHPAGTWTGGESWADVAKSLKEKDVKYHEDTILISDGETGLAEALSDIVNRKQRCQWHVIRDLYHMMWQDGALKPDITPLQRRLRSIMAIELPGESFEKVTEEAKAGIVEKMKKAENELGAFIGELREGGYHTAVRYLERARTGMFGYVRRWLALGIIRPRASSLIERVMREIARRVKRIAYNWKSEGLGKITCLLLKFFTNAEEWNEFWTKRLRFTDSVLLNFRLLKAWPV